jgi:hypothetical protein
MSFSFLFLPCFLVPFYPDSGILTINGTKFSNVTLISYTGSDTRQQPASMITRRVSETLVSGHAAP